MLEVWDIVNFVGICLEISGFFLLLPFLKKRFLNRSVTIKEQTKQSDVVEKATLWLEQKIKLKDLVLFLKEKLKTAKVGSNEIRIFIETYAEVEETQTNWYRIQNDYNKLIGQKQFGYLEWTAILLVILGLSCQGLSILLEKIIL